MDLELFECLGLKKCGSLSARKSLVECSIDLFKGSLLLNKSINNLLGIWGGHCSTVFFSASSWLGVLRSVLDITF